MSPEVHRCRYSTGSIASLRQCDELATHERRYLNPSLLPIRSRKIPCCFEHRYAIGDEGRPEQERGYRVVRLHDECPRKGCHRFAPENSYCSNECAAIERGLEEEAERGERATGPASEVRWSEESDGMLTAFADQPIKLCFAPPPEIPGQPSFVIREPEIAVPTLLLLLEMADCQLYVKATITCDEVHRKDDDRCAVCRMKDTVAEYVTTPNRESSSTLNEVK